MLKTLKIADIKIGKRHRKDMGYLSSLAESIRHDGLLQPIGVTDKFRLVFGERRLTLIVEDVLKTVMALKAKGVEFMSDPVSAPDAKHVVCAKGPDGMLIEFVQLPD